jgi:hypothetical protein
MEKTQWLKELADFIVEANKNAWAAGTGKVQTRLKDGKSLSYARGDWELEDDYTGYFSAPGMTRVLYKGRTTWSMAYFGPGQTTGQEALVKPTFSFLKEALMLVAPEMPFRGPSEYKNGEWRYTFRLSRGDITDFLGNESVYNKDTLMFAQTIGGGLVRHKDDNKQIINPWNL